ncbi:MAG: hypothetical protein N2235_05360 [Fischerella sp.]|nr:hypothetical protein [Fischerella sp.]
MMSLTPNTHSQVINWEHLDQQPQLKISNDIKNALDNFKDRHLFVSQISATCRALSRKININRHAFAHKKDRNIIDIIKPNMSTGPWIAGGAARLWYQKQNVNKHDIDVFFKNEQQVVDVINSLSKSVDSNSKLIFVSENALSFTIHDPVTSDVWHVQFIIKKYYDSAQDVINDFDFSIAQVVTDGTTAVFGGRTQEDIENKKIRLINYNRDVIRRTLKYIAYGFEPTAEILDLIKNNPNKDLVLYFENKHDEYDELL